MNVVDFCNNTVLKIIKFENDAITRKLKSKDMCLDFLDSFLHESELLKRTLIELRDTKLENIVDESIISQINNVSKFFPGKEVILLNIIKILIFYDIDTQDSIKFLFNRLEYYKKLPQNDKNKYDFAFEMFIMRLFSKEFELYSGEFNYTIDEFIVPEEIKDASIANIYFNVVRSLEYDKIDNIPSNVLNVAIIVDAISIIDGEGLENFYSYYSTDYVYKVVYGMLEVGLNEFGEIISQGLKCLNNSARLSKLQSRIYKYESQVFIDQLLENYLNQSIRKNNTKNDSDCFEES